MVKTLLAYCYLTIFIRFRFNGAYLQTFYEQLFCKFVIFLNRTQKLFVEERIDKNYIKYSGV